MRTTLAALGLTLGLLPSIAVAGDGWVADYDEAVAIAKKEGKDLFVDFTGSDWCGWCKRLKAEVFDHDAFLGPAREHFVLVSLDFPRAQEIKDQVPNPERNRELATMHSVSGYPTVLLMTAEGEVYGRTGYRQGGPDPYVTHVEELRTKGRAKLFEIIELVKAFESAQGEKRMELLDKAITQLQGLEPGAPGGKRLAVPVKAALELDYENAKGLKLRAVSALLSAGQVDDDVVTAAKQLDPKNEKGLMEKVVGAQVDAVSSQEAVEAACRAIDELVAMGPIKDQELALKFYVSAASWNVRFMNDPEAAKRYANLALPLASDNPRLQEMLQGIIDKS